MWRFLKNHSGKVALVSLSLTAIAVGVICFGPLAAGGAAITALKIGAGVAASSFTISTSVYLNQMEAEERAQEQAQRDKQDQANLASKMAKTAPENQPDLVAEINNQRAALNVLQQEYNELMGRMGTAHNNYVIAITHCKREIANLKETIQELEHRLDVNHIPRI